MSNAKAPLSIEVRRRLVERCKTRRIAHVAAVLGNSNRKPGKITARPHSGAGG